jgi:glycosyltransferase involved in cell wall biosynthesis
MRCLLLSPFVPYPPVDGGRVRILGLLEELARRCDVDVLALVRDDEDREALTALRKRGHIVEGVFEEPPSAFALARAVAAGGSLYLAKYRSAAFATGLARRLTEMQYDVVQCEYPYTGQFRLTAPSTAARWVLDAHNVEHELSRQLQQMAAEPGLLYRLYGRRETAARRDEEALICRSVEAVVAVSDADRAALAGLVPGLDPVVVPNGVDLAQFTPDEAGESVTPSGLFVGKLDYRPNDDGLRWFATAILPRIVEEIPEFELVVVGSGDPRRLEPILRSPGVRFAGRVDDILPRLHEAWVVVAPLRAGSGTRLKILEALAAGRAVVTTPIGSQGLETVAHEHVLVALDPDTFAESVVRLCRDRELRLRLGRAGRKLVERSYGWEHAGEVLANLYGELVQRRVATTR